MDRPVAASGPTKAKMERQNGGVGKLRKTRMEACLALLADGKTVDEATAKIGVTISAYKQWRKISPWFCNEVDRIRMTNAKKREFPRCPFSPESRAKYFYSEYDEPITPPHLGIAIDFINSLKPGEFGLILFPPDHAKTSLGEDWLSCGLADDPETRAAIISKTQPDASTRLLHIQTRMEDRDFYPEFINDFGPFKSEGRGKPWGARWMSLLRKTPRERDYSLQALGIGTQVQGKRLDKVLCDDIADDRNYEDYEDQATYIRQSVNTRIGNTGIGLMIGTRQGEMDVYRKLMDEDFFDKVLILPAVFPDGTTLWPARFSRDDYYRMERKAGPRVWALTYQQEDAVTEGQKFPLVLFEHCYNPMRRAQDVPQGWGRVGGLDPSASGYAAAFCLAVDRQTKLRQWIDVWNEKGLVGDGGDIMAGLRQFIVNFVKEYEIEILALERNSTFILVSTNLELRAELTALNCRLYPVESTGTGLKSQNQDILDMSIEQMSNVFANGMHSIPTGANSLSIFMPAIKQFMAYRPKNKRIVKDMLKACQFAEAAARKWLSAEMDSESHGDASNLPPYLQAQQDSVPIG